jgi:N-methylhydantoinase A/oxoprolinase/acetone carboxylase beta subunit
MIEHEASTAFMKTFDEASAEEILAVCDRLAVECAARMQAEGVAAANVETSCHADVCYVGQAHYIEVPLNADPPATLVERAYQRFCQLHDQVYGHSTRSPARFVNLRVVQRAANNVASAAPRSAPKEARKGARQILLDGTRQFVSAEIYDRDGLVAGELLHGPAIVEQADTTTLIEPGWHARIADNEVLIMTRQA